MNPEILWNKGQTICNLPSNGSKNTLCVRAYMCLQGKKMLFSNVGEMFLKLCIWIEGIQEFFVLLS